MTPLPLATVEHALRRLFLGDARGLRDEDRKKARELAALLPHLAPVDRGVVVDAAAGRAGVGLLAVELLGLRELVVIERAADRVAHCRDACAKLSASATIDLREADVGDGSAWPMRPELVVALHACGPATDAVIDAAARCEARRVMLVPCCLGAHVSFATQARAIVASWPIPRQAPIRQRLEHGLIDAWRTLRLEAAGYEVTVLPFVAPTVTPYNLLWRCRRVREPGAMARAQAKLDAILSLPA